MILSSTLLLASAESEAEGIRALFFLLYFLFTCAGVFLLAKGSQKKKQKLQTLGLVLFVAGAIGILVSFLGGTGAPQIDGRMILQIFLFGVIVIFFAAVLFWH